MKAPMISGAIRLCLLITLGCIFVSCSHDPIEDLQQTEALTLFDVESEVFDLINAHRLEAGLDELSDLDIAYPKAAEHTEYMIQTGTPSHDYFYNREAYLVNEAGASRVAENVAYAFSTARGVVDAWLESSSHKSVIEGDYTHGAICVMKDEDGKYYYTHIFVKK